MVFRTGGQAASGYPIGQQVWQILMPVVLIIYREAVALS